MERCAKIVGKRFLSKNLYICVCSTLMDVRKIWLLLLFISLSSFAEDKLFYKNLRYQATELYRIDEYRLALPMLLKVDSLKPNQKDILYKIGVSYYKIGYRKESENYLRKANDLGYKDKYILYYLGRAFHMNNEFDSAIVYLNKYKAHVKHYKKLDYTPEMVDRYIEMCEYGKILVANPVEVTIENLGPRVNSKYPDYAPVISADETVLIFTSRRTDESNKELDPRDDLHFEDLYICTREHPDSVWSEAKNMGDRINTGSHDASIGLSPDGQELFVYRSSSDKKKNISGDIWVSDLKGEEWTQPYRMHSNINSPYWEPSCSVTPDEKTLYFSSNRPGGFGGRDIYVTQKIAGDEWTEPVNLGPDINTAYDEDAPFIHPDGRTLFFSSRGHQSMGGFDLFKSVLDGKSKKWSTPENLGYPINTSDDDVFYVWSPDGSKAYFSSIREGGYGDKDIYVLKRPDIHNFIIVVRGRVLNKENSKAVAATITFTDLETNDMVGVFTSNSFNGKFTSLASPGKNYAVTVEAPGYLFHSENVNVPDVNSYLEIAKDIFLEPLKEGSKVTLNNVFFDFGKSNLKEESSQELDKLVKILQTNPNLFVEFSGHTDSVGSDAYNKKLSDERAEVVLKYMTQKGIDAKRMLAVGYGEEFPVSPNSSDEGRKMNRRTEMIIVEALDSTKLKPTLVLSKEQGYYYRRKKEEDERLAKIRAEEQRQLALMKKKQEEEALIAKSKRQDIDLKAKVKELDLAKLEISNLYFEVNKADLKDTSVIILDTLSKIMKLYPKIKIVLSGHTDSTYTEQYNLKLSQKRVEATYNFLVQKGVSAKRISKKAFGESLPKYTNETEEGRRLNRRVEIDFVKPKEPLSK